MLTLPDIYVFMKNVLKILLVLVVANILYWILGLILWNVAYMVFVEGIKWLHTGLLGFTIVKLLSYSGIVALFYFLRWPDISYTPTFYILFAVLPISVAFLITREGTWDIVRLIVPIIFHIYNIGLLSGPVGAFFGFFKDDK